MGTIRRFTCIFASTAVSLACAACAGETTNTPAVSATTTTAAGPAESPAPPPLPAGQDLPIAVTPTPTTTTPPEPTHAEDAHLTDGQIAGIASRIDLAEIDAGKLALSHAKSPSVRKFAQHMVQAHSAVESKLGSLLKAQGIATETSAVCDKLTTDTGAQKQALMGQSGFDFDRSYLEAQLKDHQEVLQLFDMKLIPETHNPAMVAALQATRAKVVEHIRMAQDALATLPAQ